MKTIFGLVPIALGLAACQTYPLQPPYGGQGPDGYPAPYPTSPSASGKYRATGTEPFWSLTIGRELVFSEANSPVRVVQPAPPARTGIAGEMYDTPRIRVNIVHAECSDGMSDRRYPDRVQVWVDGRAFNGCGAPANFYTSVDERGQTIVPPSAGPVPRLERTNWRVVAVNGRQAPARDFYLNFLPDRLSAKFGCNTLGAGYSQNGTMLTAGAVMATRMACPDMSFEDGASRVMALPMSVNAMGPRLSLSNTNGSIELVRAR